MKYKIILLIILTFLFSSNIYSNQKYISSNNWKNNKIENFTNYKISFSIKLSKKRSNIDRKIFNFNRSNLKTARGIMGAFLYIFVFVPIALLIMITGIPLVIIGFYRYYNYYPGNETNPFFISGGICLGGGLLFGVFSLFSLLK